MESLIIEATEFTPGINFDLNTYVFKMHGVSRPEDVMEFYSPIIEWLKQFDEEIVSHTSTKYDIPLLNFVIHMSYFNSSSAKSLLQVFERFKVIYNRGIKLQIDFYYDDGDEQMKEDGEDLSEAIEIPFNFIPVE